MQRKQIAPHLWKAFNKPVLHALKLIWLSSFVGCIERRGTGKGRLGRSAQLLRCRQRDGLWGCSNNPAHRCQIQHLARFCFDEHGGCVHVVGLAEERGGIERTAAAVRPFLAIFGGGGCATAQFTENRTVLLRRINQRNGRMRLARQTEAGADGCSQKQR